MAVLLLFFLSGATALIYEVLWSKHLALLLGDNWRATRAKMRDHRQMAAFYRTPVGERAVQEVLGRMRRGGEIGAEQVRAHQSELADMIRDEMQRRGTAAPHNP